MWTMALVACAFLVLALVAVIQRDKAQSRVYVLNAENSRLRDALADFRDYGIRADVTPTVNVNNTPVEWWYRYLREADANVRLRARLALQEDDELVVVVPDGGTSTSWSVRTQRHTGGTITTVKEN